MPYHIANEFMKKRVSTILETESKYKNIYSKTDGFIEDIKKEYRVDKNDSNYERLKTYLKKWSKSFENENKLDFSVNEDKILSEILMLFDGKTGTEFSQEELEDIFKEGKSRYDKKSLLAIWIQEKRITII